MVTTSPGSAQRASSGAVSRNNEEALGLLASAGMPAAMLARYLSVQSEKNNPPRGNFMEVDGVRLHYVDSGKGPPLVLFHGNGSMAQEFEISTLQDLARQHFRVIAFDRPGYGYSSRPRNRRWDATAQARLFHKALARLNVREPTVLGHSWGTLVALSMGLEFPDQVARLVLLSGYYMPVPRPDSMLLSQPALPYVGDLMRHTVAPFMGRMIWPAMVGKMFAPGVATSRWENEFPTWMALRPAQIFASAQESAMMMPEALRLSARLAELRLPISIAAGREDMHIETTLHSIPLHAALSNSDLTMLDGVGHMVHHMAPEKIMDVILQRSAAA